MPYSVMAYIIFGLITGFGCGYVPAYCLKIYFKKNENLEAEKITLCRKGLLEKNTKIFNEIKTILMNYIDFMKFTKD